MSQSNSSTVSYGVGFPGLLFITFLVLKLTHVIDWSWWWIFSPLWGSVALSLLVIIIAVVIAVVTAVKRGADR